MTISIRTNARNEFVDITQDVKKLIHDSGVQSGFAVVYSPHTTAGITINESYDPDVQTDIIAHLNRLVPPSANKFHAEGNSDAHIKASLIGPSCTIPIIDSKLTLGTWQGIYFCEFDGPRNRKIVVQVV